MGKSAIAIVISMACVILPGTVWAVSDTSAAISEALRRADRIEILVIRPDLESPVRINQNTLKSYACHIELSRGTRTMSDFSHALSTRSIRYEFGRNSGGDLRIGVIIWKDGQMIKQIYSAGVAGSDGRTIAVVDGGAATISSSFGDVVRHYFRSYTGPKMPAPGSAPTCRTL